MIKMDRPYVICHMLQSIDGRIAGNFFRNVATQEITSVYNQMSDKYDADAIIYGSRTANEIYIQGYITNSNQSLNVETQKKDFVFMNEKTKWVVVVDALGTLNWNLDNLKNRRLKDRNVIEILSENVSDTYTDNLRKLGISYIFAGREKLSMKMALEKLKNKFHIETALLQGGGIVNASFSNENLIDEISLIISPVVDGESNIPSSFEASDFVKPLLQPTSEYSIVKTEILQRSGLWINYVKNR